MIIEANFDRCAVCLQPLPLTLEHIIPESLGGTLQALIQCKKCNSDLGSELVSEAKKDPIIRIAINHLKDELSDLYLSMEEGQKYTAIDVSGESVPVRLKAGKFEIQAHKRRDGSLVLDTKRGQKNVRQILAKEGFPSDEIDEKLKAFQNAPENAKVRLSKSTSAAKWEIKSFSQSLKKPFIGNRLVALVAYNYLCLLVGTEVFDKWFDFLRCFITSGESSDRLKIESLASRRYECSHKLYCEHDQQELRIKIVFFGHLMYIVHILGLVYRGPDVAYVEDLKLHRGLIAESLAKAKQGIYLTNLPNHRIGSGA